MTMPAASQPRRSGVGRRGAAFIGLLCGVGLALVAAVTSVAAAPTASAAGARGVARTATACTYPAQQNQVLVVIDFGDVVGVGGTRPAQDVTTVCVIVPPGSRSTVALQFALDQLGWGRTLSSIGMLCSVGGYPATGCGDASGDNFLYWSYWWGVDGNWSYAGVGPASSVAKCGKVEGWRFINGAAQVGGNQAPRGDALARGMCAPPPTSSPPPTAAPDTVPPPQSQTGSTTPGLIAPGSAGTASGSNTTRPGATTAGSTTVPGGGAAHAAGSGHSAADALGAGRATDGDRGAASEGAWADVQTPAERRAATAIPVPTTSGGLRTVLQMGGSAAVVAAVGLLGVAQARRRRFA